MKTVFRLTALFLSLCLLLPLAACGPADPADGTSAPTASDTTAFDTTPGGSSGTTSDSTGASSPETDVDPLFPGEVFYYPRRANGFPEFLSLPATIRPTRGWAPEISAWTYINDLGIYSDYFAVYPVLTFSANRFYAVVRPGEYRTAGLFDVLCREFSGDVVDMFALDQDRCIYLCRGGRYEGLWIGATEDGFQTLCCIDGSRLWRWWANEFKVSYPGGLEFLFEDHGFPDGIDPVSGEPFHTEERFESAVTEYYLEDLGTTPRSCRIVLKFVRDGVETTRTAIFDESGFRPESELSRQLVPLDATPDFPEGFATPLCAVWAYPGATPELAKESYALTGVQWQTDDRTMWCVGRGDRTGGRDYEYLYVTRDAGATWENVSRVRRVLAPGAITGVYVDEAGRGVFTVLESPSAASEGLERPFNVFVTDAGDNWRSLFAPEGGGFRYKDSEALSTPVEGAYGEAGAVLFAGIGTVGELWAALRDLRLDVRGDRVQIVCTLEIDGKTVENRLDFN